MKEAAPNGAEMRALTLAAKDPGGLRDERRADDVDDEDDEDGEHDGLAEEEAGEDCGQQRHEREDDHRRIALRHEQQRQDPPHVERPQRQAAQKGNLAGAEVAAEKILDEVGGCV